MPFQSIVLKRTVIGCLIVASLGFVWWTITSRVSLIQEAHSEIRSTFSLDHEIAALQTRWAYSSTDISQGDVQKS